MAKAKLMIAGGPYLEGSYGPHGRRDFEKVLSILEEIMRRVRAEMGGAD